MTPLVGGIAGILPKDVGLKNISLQLPNVLMKNIDIQKSDSNLGNCK